MMNRVVCVINDKSDSIREKTINYLFFIYY